MTNVSVVMATYNGADFIQEQIDSIIEQLPNDGELIIYDDGSSDATLHIISSFVDKRIVLIAGNVNVGVNRAFEAAIKEASGDYIFLADQDDIWKVGRLKLMLDAFKKNDALLVSGRFDFINRSSQLIDMNFNFLRSRNSDRNYNNIFSIFSGKANYYGCAMAIHKDLLGYILPFPSDLESHDLWIALCANVLKRNVHLDDLVLSRRLHGGNLSVVNRSLASKLKSRLIFAKHFLMIYFRVFKLRYLK